MRTSGETTHLIGSRILGENFGKSMTCTVLLGGGAGAIGRLIVAPALAAGQSLDMGASIVVGLTSGTIASATGSAVGLVVRTILKNFNPNCLKRALAGGVGFGVIGGCVVNGVVLYSNETVPLALQLAVPGACALLGGLMSGCSDWFSHAFVNVGCGSLLGFGLGYGIGSGFSSVDAGAGALIGSMSGWGAFGGMGVSIPTISRALSSQPVQPTNPQ